MVPSLRCGIDPETLWSLSTFKPAGLQTTGFFKEYSPSGGGQPSEDARAGDITDSTSISAKNFTSFSFEGAQSLDEKRFKLFVDELPWELFRLKGSVIFADRKAFLNFIVCKSEWLPLDGEVQTRLVFIGWNVDADQILDRLKACIVT